MSNLKLVKDLRKEQVGLLEILGAYVLQEKQNVDFYDKSKQYKRNDIIIVFDEATKRYNLKRCLRNTTGNFDNNSWVSEKLHDANNIVNRDSFCEDMLSMMNILYGVTGGSVKFNHVYINDISDVESIQVHSGIKEPGLLCV